MMAGWTMGIEAWILMGAWAFVLVLIVWLLVREPHHDAREVALETLRGRFARGEITPDEFERAKDLLDSP
jgi:uncharacterized membrane protein